MNIPNYLTLGPKAEKKLKKKAVKKAAPAPSTTVNLANPGTFNAPIPSPQQIKESVLVPFLARTEHTEEQIRDLDLSLLNIEAVHLYNLACAGPMSINELAKVSNRIHKLIEFRRKVMGMNCGPKDNSIKAGSIFVHA